LPPLSCFVFVLTPELWLRSYIQRCNYGMVPRVGAWRAADAPRRRRRLTRLSACSRSALISSVSIPIAAEQRGELRPCDLGGSRLVCVVEAGEIPGKGGGLVAGQLERCEARKLKGSTPNCTPPHTRPRLKVHPPRRAFGGISRGVVFIAHRPASLPPPPASGCVNSTRRPPGVPPCFGMRQRPAFRVSRIGTHEGRDRGTRERRPSTRQGDREGGKLP